MDGLQFEGFDFDLPDFDPGGFGEGLDLDAFALDAGFSDGIGSSRYGRPRLNPYVRVDYEYAEQFAEAFEFSPDMRVFAFVSGNFIFGDFIEALVHIGKITVKRMTIQTLSMSQENIDGLRNVIDMMEGELEALHLIMSDYWYAHERNPQTGLVPYLFQELDVVPDFRAAFASVHTKIVTIETLKGNKIVIHGSVNFRSSRNVEQVCIEVDEGLYDYVEGFAARILDAYDVVNQGVKRNKSLRGGELWQAAAAAAVAAGSEERPEAPTAEGRTVDARPPATTTIGKRIGIRSNQDGQEAAEGVSLDGSDRA